MSSEMEEKDAEKNVVSKVLIQNDECEFLMLRKSDDYGYMSEKWEQPGGKLEEGEDCFEAARREVREETGLEIDNLEDLVRLEIEDEEELVECHVLFTDSFTGDIDLEEEHQEYRWVSRGEALDLEWHRNAAYILPVIEYLEDYRESEKNYGSEDRTEIVKLLIQNDEGKFLVVRKSDQYDWKAGKWELPGGKIEEGNRFSASRREIKEETGIELGEIKEVVREEIEEGNDVDTFIIFCDDWEGEVDLSKEHQEYRWVDADEYKKMNWHQDAGYGYPPMKFLEDYLENS